MRMLGNLLDNLLTITALAVICNFCILIKLFLLLSDADYKTKNSYSIMVLGVIVFVLFLYSGYMLLGV